MDVPYSPDKLLVRLCDVDFVVWGGYFSGGPGLATGHASPDDEAYRQSVLGLLTGEGPAMWADAANFGGCSAAVYVFFGPDHPLAPSDNIRLRVSGQCYGEYPKNPYFHYGYVGYRGGVWGENEVTVEYGAAWWARSSVSTIDLPLRTAAENGDLIKTFYLYASCEAGNGSLYSQAHAEISLIEVLGIDRPVSERRRVGAMMTMERRRTA